MSLKTILNKEFLFNLLLIANYFFHNKIKNINLKKNLTIIFKHLKRILKIKKSDLENYYLYLHDKNIIFESMNYVFVNLTLLKKIIKIEKTKNRRNIILQPNFELLVKPEIQLDIFLFLIQIAEIKSKDVVCKFAITKNSLHNAFQHEITPNQIKSFLINNIVSDELPHNVEYLIDDVYKRIGEIKIGYSSGYIAAEDHIFKGILNDNIIQKKIIKTIFSSTGLLKKDINLWDIYFYLKKKNYFPAVDTEKVVQTKDDLQVFLDKDEAEYFLTTLYTLKEIGFEHYIKVDFNLLNNLSNRIEAILGEKIISKAKEQSSRYKQELKSSIKSYVLKSLSASLAVPQNLVLDKIAVNYEGDNPATIRKEIIKMIEFAMNHKSKVLIGYYMLSKKIEQFIVPKYLYDNRVLYFYNKEAKEEESIVLTKIVFTALL